MRDMMRKSLVPGPCPLKMYDRNVYDVCSMPLEKVNDFVVK